MSLQSERLLSHMLRLRLSYLPNCYEARDLIDEINKILLNHPGLRGRANDRPADSAPRASELFSEHILEHRLIQCFFTSQPIDALRILSLAAHTLKSCRFRDS